LKFGAEVPFLRPVDLAKDDSPEWLSWRHGLEFLLTTTGNLPQAMVSLPPTAPLRVGEDIERCLNEFEKHDSDVVITVTDAHRNPYFNMVKTSLDGSVTLVNKMDTKISHRQDAPVLYDVTTICYVAKPEFVMNHNSMFEGRVKSVYVPIERSIDIDSLLDFEIAAFLKNREATN
jgi:N-acylneuraminate cytidylyltransferase